MPTRSRRGTALSAPIVLALALIVGACGSAAPTSSGTASTSQPSVAATIGETATASAIASPSAAATPSSSASGVACDFEPQTGELPSDRLTGMDVLGVPGKDIVRFEFGSDSLSPAGRPTGALTVAVPPFTHAASGKPIDLDGEHALQLVFTNMSISNDLGEPTFTGQREVRVAAQSRSLRHVIMYDESEGQIGWYVGYDGPTCVTLSREGSTVVLGIQFGASSE
jgi:hypothetical protein